MVMAFGWMILVETELGSGLVVSPHVTLLEHSLGHISSNTVFRGKGRELQLSHAAIVAIAADINIFAAGLEPFYWFSICNSGQNPKLS
jgi:hypothetical protein